MDRADDAATGADTALGPRERHVRSFALRRGHVTKGQQRAFDDVFPALAVALPPPSPAAASPLDLRALFGDKPKVILEIGFGMGETTAAIAQAHPAVGFLCVEVFVAGIGALAKRVDELALANIRIIQADAVEVVDRALAADSLDGVHIFFPDPWPKARHHKRRLIAQPFVGRLAAKIRSGGYLHCATDWENYAQQMLAVLSAEPALRNLHDGFAPASVNPLGGRPVTKFHARGERLGHGVWDLLFERRAADAATERG